MTKHPYAVTNRETGKVVSVAHLSRADAKIARREGELGHVPISEDRAQELDSQLTRSPEYQDILYFANLRKEYDRVEFFQDSGEMKYRDSTTGEQMSANVPEGRREQVSKLLEGKAGLFEILEAYVGRENISVVRLE